MITKENDRIIVLLMTRSRIFIGSSTEQLNTARALAKVLQSSGDATVWDELEFAPGLSIFEKLLNAADQFDFAVFVFRGDDVANVRGINAQTVRDNVVFELGLFIGKMGKDRAWWVSPPPSESLRTLTDLAGIEHLTLSAANGGTVSNLEQALADVGRKISIQIEKSGPKTHRTMPVLDHVRILCASSSEYPEERFEDDIREIQRNFPPRSVTELRNVSADTLAEHLRPKSSQPWDVIHLAANVDVETGDMILPNPDPAKRNPLRDRFPRRFFMERIEESQARLVVMPSCESVIAAARIAGLTNVIAAIHKIELPSVITWAKEFYWYLAEGYSLNDSFNRAQPLDPCLLLLIRQDFRFELKRANATTQQ